METLEDLASPIGAFIRERCDVGAAYSADIAAVYVGWSQWCETQGREHAGTVQTFGRDLRAAVPGLKTAQIGTGDARVRTYQGLGLKK